MICGGEGAYMLLNFILILLFVFSLQSEEDFSFIEVVDSEDEDLQRALQESLTSSAAANIGYG